MSQIIDVPNKSHFKSDEICSITSIKPYVLRFWESEFEEINSSISNDGKKLYSQKDIEIICFIKELLFDKKMTIERSKAEVTKCFGTKKVFGESFFAEKVEKKRVEDNTKKIDQDKIILVKQRLKEIVSITERLKKTDQGF